WSWKARPPWSPTPPPSPAWQHAGQQRAGRPGPTTPAPRSPPNTARPRPGHRRGTCTASPRARRRQWAPSILGARRGGGSSLASGRVRLPGPARRRRADLDLGSGSGTDSFSAAKAAVRVRQPISIPPGRGLTNGGVTAAHRLVHGLQEAVDCPIADLGAVDDPLFDRLPEVEPDEDAGESVLVCCLGKGGVPPQDGRRIGAGLPWGQCVAAALEADVVGTEELLQGLCCRTTFDTMSRVVVRNRW